MKTGYSIGTDGFPSIVKDTTAALDYCFNWTEWLETTETIATVVSVVVAPTGALMVNSSPLDPTNKMVVAWLSGGTTGVTYRVSVKITTSMGRTDTRSINVKVQLR